MTSPVTQSTAGFPVQPTTSNPQADLQQSSHETSTIRDQFDTAPLNPPVFNVPARPTPKPGGKKGFKFDLPVITNFAGGGAVVRAPGIVSQIADTNVYVGSLIDAGNIEALKAGEFTHVLNLALDSDGTVAPNPNDLKAAGIQERRIPLRDNTDATDEFRIYLKQALDFVRDARKGGGNILIHCHHGISRSVAVAIADRMHQLAQQHVGALAPNFYHQALKEVQDARQLAGVEAMPNFGFSLVLEELNQTLGGGN